MITQSQVDRLLQFRDGESLVTSCYLDLDRSKMPPAMLKIRLKDLIQAAHHELAAKAGSHVQRESLRADFSRIEEFVMASISAAPPRALAIFSCAAEKFWQVFELPRVMRNTLIADHEPYVRPLTAILAEYRRFGVVVVDHQQGRLFEVHLGEIAERAGVTDAIPRHGREGGLGGRDERNIERHHAESVHQHFQRVAAAALVLFNQHQFDALVLGGHRDVLREFKQHLHPYLKERWVGDFQADVPQVTAAAVLAQTLKIEEQVGWEHEKQVTAEVVRKTQAGDRAVHGVAATLAAVSRGEVRTLLVEDGFELPGYRCGRCRFVTLDAGLCPQCHGPTTPCPDVVDEAVVTALQQNCRVEHVRSLTPLREVGRIGALLRYQTGVESR
jgi:peptide chain release factor subunit 1